MATVHRKQAQPRNVRDVKRPTPADVRRLSKRIQMMYEMGEMIIICSLSLQEYRGGKRDTAFHKIDGVWLAMAPPVKDYRNYSHGLSPQMAAIYYPDFWRRHMDAPPAVRSRDCPKDRGRDARGEKGPCKTA